MTFRLLDPTESAEVETNVEGAPMALTWRGRRIVVGAALGPERLSGDWWRDGYSRDYWRCATLEGELLVYRDRTEQSDAWQVQGWYD